MSEIQQKMRAMVLTGHGGPEVLEYHEDWPVPQLGAGEVLIKVHACGLNNTDINTRTGWYSKGVTGATETGAQDTAEDEDATWGGAPITFPRIQGADVAGTVVAAADDVGKHLIDKRVLVDTWVRDWNDPMNMEKCGYFGSETDGGYADYTKADARNVHAIDSALNNAELATFATSYVTAENMLNRANVGEGDTVLIPGASGGVGSALIQLAMRRGAKTIAMASEAKHDQVRSVAPDALLPRAPVNLKAALKNAIGRNSVSVVADVVGGDGFGTLIDALERGGRYTCAGAIAGPIVEFDLRTFYLKDLTFTGATIVPPGTFADLVGYIERGEIKPLLAETFALKDLNAAQAAFTAKNHLGNIVVVLE
ncbi:MAG: alcohol dehydrogenase family protein [Hyphomicrobiales bacterium]